MIVRFESNAISERQAYAARLNAQYGDYHVDDLLSSMIGSVFCDKIAVVSSFGAESALLLYYVSRANKHTPVIFLDSLKHFAQTLAYRDQLKSFFGLTNVKVMTPLPEALAADDPHGDLHTRDPDRCCHIRKTLPMIRGLQGVACWITGRKRYQSAERNDLALFETQDRWIKLNPMIRFAPEEIEAAYQSLELPRHPLVTQGYASIGCAPCTTPVTDSEEDPRAGRWREQPKTECGIHFVDGKIVRA